MTTEEVSKEAWTDTNSNYIALDALVKAIHNHTKMNLPLLDEAWYAYEVAARVLEGDTYPDALQKLVEPDIDPPKLWKEEAA